MRQTLPTLCALAAGLALALPALGQTASGTGRGLEKDLRVGGGGNTPRRDFGAEVRLRNSLVTGNAAGGRGLRINAPYSDPAEFRDTLGSSDIFAFRRDSLYSGLGGQGFRGTEGLQYQFGWTTGGSGGLVLSRTESGAGSSATSLTSSAAINSTRLASKSWEVATPVTGAMRSTAAFTATRSLTPTAVGTRRYEDGTRELVAASSLLGLRGIAIEDREPWNESYGNVKAPAAQTPLGSVKVTTPGQPAPSNPLAAQPVGTSAVPEASPGPTTSPASTNAGRTAYDDLRARLDSLGNELNKNDQKAGEANRNSKDTPQSTPDSTKPKAPTPGTGASPDSPTPGDDAQSSAWERRMDSLRRTLGSAEMGGKKGDTTSAIDAGTLRAIRQAGQATRTTSALTLGSTNVFADHVTAAEKLMGEEKYFDAEERFTRAITVRPGDANALAGRINAQLGSGLLMSAAVNLRTLAVTKPDAIGMLFAGNLLPSKARQDQLLTQLRTNLSPDGKSEGRLPKESALLLAYLGYQRSDPATVREGLDAFQAIASPEEQALLTLLRGVWIGEDAPTK